MVKGRSGLCEGSDWDDLAHDGKGVWMGGWVLRMNRPGLLEPRGVESAIPRPRPRVPARAETKTIRLHAVLPQAITHDRPLSRTTQLC